MLPYELSDADIDTVKMTRNSHSCAKVRVRLWILWLLHLDFSRFETATIAGCHTNTVTRRVKDYQAGGLDRIVNNSRTYDVHLPLKRFYEVRKALVDEGIHTIQQGRDLLAQKFAYDVNWESARQLMHRLGLKRRKINPFPGNPKIFGGQSNVRICI